MPRPFRWLDAGPLWRSRNDTLARTLHDPVSALRRRWMLWLTRRDGAPAGDPPALVVRDLAGREAVRFLVLGDPGEGDTSQWVVVPPLLEAGRSADFLFICSDVVYPIGDVNEYVEKFFEPYAGWRGPIFAVPGNHDWYDGLEGFMRHICGVPPPPREFERELADIPGTAGVLWRRPRGVRPATLEAASTLRPDGGVRQPGPYFALDVGPIAVVGIDTGISGAIDRDQGRWLQRVSRELDKPKILITGKPIYVDGQYHPGAIEGVNETVDGIVRRPEHRYVAAIGGDIHNYQRYPVQLGDGRTIEYVVSGGGGAFMHATHRIPRVELDGVDERGFRCFPLRGASLAFYARVVRRELRRLLRELLTVVAISAAWVVAAATLTGGSWWGWEVGALGALPGLAAIGALVRLEQLGAMRIAWFDRGAHLTQQQASAWLADRLGERPTLLESAGGLPEGSARLAQLIYPRFRRTRGLLHSFFSEIMDVDEPPLFKQFLEIEADRATVRIRCYAAIGTELHGRPPLLEDEVVIDLASAP